MPNRILNFCYNIAAKHEDMEVAEQDNQPKEDANIIQRNHVRIEARKAMDKYLNNVRRHNTDVKLEAYRGVRRPGKDHSRLFQALDQLVGSLNVKKQVIREVKDEALRFKRQALAQQVERYMVKMETSHDTPARVDICKHCALVHAASSYNCKGRNFG